MTEPKTSTKIRGDEQNVAFKAGKTLKSAEAMGLTSGHAWQDDPKRLVFTMSRYKFVAKMLEGYDKVLEVGCADGFSSKIVRQTVGNLVGLDIDEDYLASARAIQSEHWPIEFHQHDMLSGPFGGAFDAVYSLDVLEHIAQEDEDQFISNMIASLKPNGVCIVGMPSLQSQDYASAYSRIGHVNCKDQPSTKALFEKFFHNVFMFSMNDEVVHTGFQAMSHYNFALCCGPKPLTDR